MAGKRPPNWAKIRAAYEAGEGSYRQLAERFKVSFNTLQVRAKKESWTSGRDKVYDSVTTEVRQAIVEKKVDKVTSDIEILDSVIQKLKSALDIVEPKSMEGVANALTKTLQVKNQVAPPTAEGLAEVAIANGISPEDFIKALAKKWQEQQQG